MKTAIYIEDGVFQVVLTPEGDFEEKLIKEMEEHKLTPKIMFGGFYDCRGGWVRQADFNPMPTIHTSDKAERSLIIRLKDEHDKI